MNPVEKLISIAAVDVAVERLLGLHPHAQFFVFGPEGEPFWARFATTEEELALLRLALVLIEQTTRPAPFTVRGASGRFSAMVLDAERTLFAVVLLSPARRLPGEAKVGHTTAPSSLASWRR